MSDDQALRKTGTDGGNRLRCNRCWRGVGEHGVGFLEGREVDVIGCQIPSYLVIEMQRSAQTFIINRQER